MNKNKIMPTVVLSVICLIIACILAVVNMFTSPVIKEAEEEKVQQTLQEVMENGENFVKFDFSSYNLPKEIKEVYTEDGGGYVFKVEEAGYKSGFVIMCGVDSDGKVTGSKWILSSETNGAENKIDGKYNGAFEDNLEPELIAGSTKTSKAYFNAVNKALSAFKTVKEGN